MPAWYDIYSLGVDARQDEQGIVAASAELDKFVEAELRNGISAKRIIIGGFSQGGSVALYNALTNKHEYGGVVLLSSWLPVHSKFISDDSLVGIPRQTPLLQCHGKEDCVIPFQMGKATHELLKGFHLTNCDFNSYPDMGHSSGIEELQDVKEFLKKNLPPL
jgi:predicted esterase